MAFNTRPESERDGSLPFLVGTTVLHAPGHLVGAGRPGQGRRAALRCPRPVRAEVRAWGVAPQELPQVALAAHSTPRKTRALQRRKDREADTDAGSMPPPSPPSLPPRFPPSWVQTPSRLIMFLCRPISFITSISETRSAKSLSEALSVRMTARVIT